MRFGGVFFGHMHQERVLVRVLVRFVVVLVTKKHEKKYCKVEIATFSSISTSPRCHTHIHERRYHITHKTQTATITPKQ